MYVLTVGLHKLVVSPLFRIVLYQLQVSGNNLQSRPTDVARFLNSLNYSCLQQILEGALFNSIQIHGKDVAMRVPL